MNFEKLFRDPIMDHCKKQGFSSVVEMINYKYSYIVDRLALVYWFPAAVQTAQKYKENIRYWLSLINYASFARIVPLDNWSAVYESIDLYSDDLMWLDAILCWMLNYCETNERFKHYYPLDPVYATDLLVTEWNWNGYPSVSMSVQRVVDEAMLYRMSQFYYFGQTRILMPPTQLIYRFLRDNFPHNKPFNPRYARDYCTFLCSTMSAFPTESTTPLDALRYYTLDQGHKYHKCEWPPFSNHSLLSKEEFAEINGVPLTHPLVTAFRHRQLLERFRSCYIVPKEKHQLEMQHNRLDTKHLILNVTKKVLASKKLQKPVKRQEHCYSPPYDHDDLPDYLEIQYEQEAQEWQIFIDGEWYCNVTESPFEP
jgi:hypothetical protein